MSATGSHPSSDPGARPGEPLVPILQGDPGAPDPVALATWHLALSAATAVEVPNDIFALWLYPAAGGVVLLGPEALAQDRVQVPLPAPQLLQDDLYRLEEVLRKAKYDSAIAVPVRHEARDVGVMLLGKFERGAFGPTQAVALYRLAGRLAPAMAQLAEATPSAATHPALEPLITRDELPEFLARAACESVSGPDLVRRVSGMLYTLLPHDRLEILVPGAVEGAYAALSGSAPRRRWSSASGGAEAYASLVDRFAGERTLLLEDLDSGASPVAWILGSGSGPAHLARSVLGARLEVGGSTAGYLLLGSVARDAYHPDDEELLGLAGLILAPRVAGLRVPEPSEAFPATDSRELPLARAADILADTAHLGDALSGFAVELGQLLPHRGISLYLRRGEDELFMLDPRAPRPLADLPALAVESFEGAAVLEGDREWQVQEVDALVEVLVPLRVAGRTMGVLGVRSDGFDSSRGAAAIARQFADVLAPHLELLRRGAVTGGLGTRERASAR
ncbi:MAG TPA: hypothetical protein VL241_04600 [Gemmatimonadales bacterium]|nr:hypothetical protein [Gemmatimonadales bacterium]